MAAFCNSEMLNSAQISFSELRHEIFIVLYEKIFCISMSSSMSMFLNMKSESWISCISEYITFLW